MYWARGLIPRFRLSFLRRRVFGMHAVMFSSADKLKRPESVRIKPPYIRRARSSTLLDGCAFKYPLVRLGPATCMTCTKYAYYCFLSVSAWLWTRTSIVIYRWLPKQIKLAKHPGCTST